MSCFSCLCCLSGRSHADARAEASLGLKEMIKGYQRISKLELTPSTVHVVAQVRRAIMQLEVLLAGAQMPKPRPWLAPLEQEKRDWETIYPMAGTLLRRQVCLAEKDSEWFLGGLFISECGLVFDTGGSGDSDYSISEFTQWDEIVSISNAASATVATGSANDELELSVKGRGKMRLQLTISDDAQWIEQFWKLCSRSPLPPMPDESDEDLPFVLGSTSNHALLTSPVSQKKKRFLSVADEDDGRVSGTGNEHAQGILSLRKRSMSITDRISASMGRSMSSASATFVPEVKGGPLPSATMPHEGSNCSPIGTERVGYVSISAVRAMMEKEAFLREYVQEAFKAYEIKSTNWVASKQVSGTFSRKIRFMMKLPKEVPRALAAMVKIPEASRVTVVFRLRSTDEEVVLSSQCCTHEVPFGENFRVQETCGIRGLFGGGVEVKKWTDIIWTSPLSWAFRSLQNMIEKRAKAETKNSLPTFAAIVGRMSADE
eukprot:TRINITY_DN56668_c0_g1_i1.p1 TRINITY_DN56668_c0_g1~~TRINITY_DN56668_c0_g1_i1.p1  ORF type:complete len:488 (-),score=58.81 TRINITY_DN56668_c0_g1_i1:59-1522(-)